MNVNLIFNNITIYVALFLYRFFHKLQLQHQPVLFPIFTTQPTIIALIKCYFFYSPILLITQKKGINLMQEFNNRIHELREEKHITQVRLSTELGVAQETISAYEQGRHLPSVTTLIKLSNILGASMDYIMMQSDIRNYINSESLNNNEIRLINYFKKLNISCKEKALSYIEGLSDGIASDRRAQDK